MAQTSNEKIYDAFIKHQIYLIQLSNGISRDASKLLSNTEESVEKTILYYATNLESTPRNSPAFKKLKQKLADEIAKIRSPVWKILSTSLTDEMLELATAEASFVGNVVNKSIPLAVPLQYDYPKKADLKKGVENTILAEGKVLKEWMETLERVDRERIVGKLTDSITNGLTATNAVKAVMGTANQKQKDGVIRKAQSSMSAIVQTITTGTASNAQQQFASKNTFVISKEIFRATLDENTTSTCSSKDGNVYDVGKGPQLPLHFRCRSVYIPFISHESLWTRAFDPSTEKTLIKEYAQQNKLGNITGRADLPRGTKGTFDKFSRQRKRALIGRLPDKKNYSDFLRNQSDDFADEVLGKARGKIWREQGKPNLTKFVNSSGNYLTLKQLKSKYY